MSGAQMVIACLEQEQIDLIFGFPGGAVLSLYDALYDSSLKHILTRHEQAAVHAADGYARISGKPGVVFATSGPGATNLVTGIATAYMDSVPLILVTGQVASNMIGTDAFQEADITGITLPITKHNYLIKNVKDIPVVFKEAFYLATTGRKGPVLIDLPKDVQNDQAEFCYPEEVYIQGYKPTLEGHPGQIIRAANAIKKAKKPIIYSGGGVVHAAAWDELRAVAEKGCIPVTTTLTGLGAFPTDHELFLGMPGMHGTVAANYALSQADLIIAAGARFDDRVTGRLDCFARQACVIHIDVDPAEIGKNVEAQIPIVGDVRKVLEQLLLRMEAGDTGAWLEQVNLWKKQYPLTFENSGDVIRPQYVIKELYRLTAGEAIVTTDVGQHQMWAAQYLHCKYPRSFASSGGLGTMGFGFPAALGAQVAAPGRVVLCITGDGSFQMNIQELATASRYRLPVKIAIINNSYLGMVRQWQELFYNKRYAETFLEGNPDFVKVAEAYNIMGLKASRPEEVEPVIRKALEHDGPVLMDFVVASEENVFPMVAPNTPIDEIIGGGSK
ncbi:MAG: biosynthetic-type acetolactate synthase large subunit [Firmicutes bacterium]|nr:biosynthetic-type acetolactate synthase large subunit [Bacillota bacterium]